jgi:hypothetical protein
MPWVSGILIAISCLRSWNQFAPPVLLRYMPKRAEEEGFLFFFVNSLDSEVVFEVVQSPARLEARNSAVRNCVATIAGKVRKFWMYILSP